MVIKMLIGEQRNLSFLIKSITDADAIFNIRHAEYELFNGDDLEDSGQCTINEHVISAYISPKQKSKNYILILTYKIADETLKDRYRIEVS